MRIAPRSVELLLLLTAISGSKPWPAEGQAQATPAPVIVFRPLALVRYNLGPSRIDGIKEGYRILPVVDDQTLARIIGG